MVKSAANIAADTRILELAADHIRRYGVERTTVVSIAKAAGMSHANVYRYFPSKEALIDAVTDQWLKPVEAGLRDIAEAPDPADDKVERMLAVLHRAYRAKLEDDANIFNLFAEAALGDRAISRRHRNRVQAELHKVVDEGMANGVFTPGDLRRAVALVFDVAYRFIHPAPVRLDAGVPRAQIDARFERVSRLARRALVSGVR
jgi:AcrR family transcriptional regulator